MTTERTTLEKLNSYLSEAKTLLFQNKSMLTFTHDLFAVLFSLNVSLFLRLGDSISQVETSVIAINVFLYLLIATAVFLGQHIYKSMWRYSSMGDLISISLSVTYITLLFLPIMLILPQDMSLPRSTPFINWFVLIAFLGAPRFLYRVQRQYRSKALLNGNENAKKALIIGMGDQTELFIRELLRQNDNSYHLVGIIGFKESQKGRKIHHVEVVGTLIELPAILDKFKAHENPVEMLVVADESLSPQDLKSLLTLSNSYSLQLTRLPHISEITAPAAKPQVQSVAIEDLLGRPQATLDRESMKTMITGKKVLVTGAGGTIGSELVRQICNFSPSEVILLDHNEYALYKVSLALKEAHPNLAYKSIIRDITVRDHIRKIISSHKPELVFHAAALKHVPLVEENPCQGTLINSIGTRNVADACRDFNVQAMLLVSTDKAINPTSVMGATKRLAECYCQALDIIERQKTNGTRYASVRFGNVLGSSGSVVPLFKHQIDKGGPLTITHPEMTRYFMTVHEAVELVLQAMTYSINTSIQGGRVFVLDMGDPVKILDMAKQMIHLAGLKPDVDIQIKFTGLRPGEKLFEELFHSSENLLPTNNKHILLGSPRTVDYGFLQRAFQDLEAAASTQDKGSTLRILQALVPEYKAVEIEKENNLKTAG